MTLDHFKVHLHFILYNFSLWRLEKCALVTGFLQSYVCSGSLLLMKYFDATVSVELLSKKNHNNIINIELLETGYMTIG